MGYHDRDRPEPQARDAPSVVQIVFAAGVRAIGVAVLLIGLWAGVKVILEAWALYEQPQRIERLAVAVQQGSNIDGVLGSLAVSVDAPQGDVAAAAAPRAAGGSFRLSYFAAWFIALLLMFVIGSLAMAAVTTGGRLALYDLAVKQHAREVMREVRELRRAA